jgi:hypothetical protein
LEGKAEIATEKLALVSLCLLKIQFGFLMIGISNIPSEVTTPVYFSILVSVSSTDDIVGERCGCI